MVAASLVNNMPKLTLIHFEFDQRRFLSFSKSPKHQSQPIEFTHLAVLMGRPRNLPVAYLVTQVGNWGTGSDDVGLIQSTKAPNQSSRASAL